jgi:hypothetical protein
MFPAATSLVRMFAARAEGKQLPTIFAWQSTEIADAT